MGVEKSVQFKGTGTKILLGVLEYHTCESKTYRLLCNNSRGICWSTWFRSDHGFRRVYAWCQAMACQTRGTPRLPPKSPSRSHPAARASRRRMGRSAKSLVSNQEKKEPRFSKVTCSTTLTGRFLLLWNMVKTWNFLVLRFLILPITETKVHAPTLMKIRENLIFFPLGHHSITSGLQSPRAEANFSVDRGLTAEPGFMGVQPGRGVRTWPPVSVCQNVSTTEQRSPPTTR